MTLTFESWLAGHYAGAEWAHGACDGCEANGQELVGGYCASCLRYQFGFDQAQELMLTTTIGAALRSALAEVPEQDLREVVEEAFRAYHGEQVTAALRSAS